MRNSFVLKVKPFILSLTVLVAGCGKEVTPPTVQPASAREMRASVVEIRPVDMAVQIPIAGSVVAQDAVKVTSRVMGYIRDLNVIEGQTIKKGELLFVIDPVDVQGAVAQAEQGLVQAQAALRDARADFERFEQLYKDQVINRQQYEKMKLNLEVAKSRVAQAEAGLAQARGQFAYTRVAAPIDGVVTAKLANEGDLAAPGHPIVLIEDVSRLQVQTSVPETIFRRLQLGMVVQVEIEGQPHLLTAKVARLSPAADPIAHTYPVKLDVEAPGLRSGVFARVLFTLGTRQVISVPERAVVQRAGIKGVFVVKDDGLAEFRMVRTGSQADGMVEIIAGLKVGERVVVEGASQVLNGDKIVVDKAS
ncbi:MAG: efflux RND transporter periplasmic adaptor subunit [Gammaproteobacteria bacterium]|nr:efflux RND transporter periplasmic adaptor subunit [Gammaproteobacteria bacterium]